MTLSYEPQATFASSASLKVESFVASPPRGSTLTSVGGSVKLSRSATSVLPSRERLALP